MRWHGRRVAVYAHRTPTDMRKGFDSLCALVTEQLTRNPLFCGGPRSVAPTMPTARRVSRDARMRGVRVT
jgi:hypothetical protein